MAGGVKEASSELPKISCLTELLAIDVRGVQKRRILVDLFTWTQSLLPGERSGMEKYIN